MDRKTRNVIFSSWFHTSVKEIWQYISQNSVQNANKFVNDLEKEVEAIKKAPESYRLFSPWRNKKRFYRYRIFKKNYYIIFLPTKSKLLFIRIIHAKRSDEYINKLPRS